MKLMRLLRKIRSLIYCRIYRLGIEKDYYCVLKKMKIIKGNNKKNKIVSQYHRFLMYLECHSQKIWKKACKKMKMKRIIKMDNFKEVVCSRSNCNSSRYKKKIMMMMTMKKMIIIIKIITKRINNNSRNKCKVNRLVSNKHHRKKYL